MDSYFYFQQPNLFQFECKCRDKISVSGTLYLINLFCISYIVPNTENSYFPMSSTMYLIPKKNVPNTEFCGSFSLLCIVACRHLLLIQSLSAARVCVCSCCPGIVSYPPPLVGWPLQYIQRQLGNPVRNPDLVTACRDGAVWKHRRLPSGYGAVLRAVVLALRREFRDRIESESTLTAQHISSILPLSAAHPPA